MNKLWNTLRGWFGYDGNIADYLGPGSHDLSDLHFPPNPSGVNVTLERALTIPSLYRGVDLIASKIAGLPIEVLKREGDKHPYFKNHAANILFRQPNPITPRFQWVRAILFNAILKGNGYAIIERDQAGSPVYAWQVEPSCIYPDWEAGELVYRFSPVNGPQQILPFTDVIHVKGLSCDGVLGFSLIQTMASALGIGIQARDFQAKGFANGRLPPYAIEGASSDSQSKDYYSKQLAEKHSGIDAASRPLILTGAAKAVALSLSSHDMELIETRKFTDNDVANMLGIPPHMVGLAISTSYSSIEAQNRAFYDDCLSKWISALEDEFTCKLLSEAEKDNESVLISFNLKAFLRPDTKTLVDIIVTQLNNGIIDREEAQRLLDIELGPDAKYRLPANIAYEPEEAEEGASTEPQLEALNGLQISSLVELATQVATKALPPEAVTAICKMAFPTADPALIDAIVSSSASFEPAPPPAPPGMAPKEAPNAGEGEPASAPEPAPEATPEAPERGFRGLLAHSLERLSQRVAKSGKPAAEHADIIRDTLRSAFPDSYETRTEEFILNCGQSTEEILKIWKI